jgi:hypothetical protein
VGPEDIEKPEDYPEAILVYNETVGWDRIYNQGARGDRHTRVYLMLTASERSGCTKTHFRAFIDELKSVFGSAITGFDLQVLDPETNVTRTAGHSGGMYQASFVLHLWEFGVSTSSAAAGGSAGATYWSQPFVCWQASTPLTAEKLLQLTATDTLADLTLTNSLTVKDITISGAVTGLEDADIPDTITLTDITQITGRSITDLTATAWRLFYSGAGAVPIELALGASGTFLKSNGAAAAPTWAAAGGDAFKTITGITNDVVAEQTDDTLTLASADAKLTIVGTAATDTITFSVVEGQIDHDALTNFAANEHFTEASIALANLGTKILPNLTDVTMTGAELEDALAFGSGNVVEFTCPYSGDNPSGCLLPNTGLVTGAGGTDGSAYFHLPVPYSLGSLTLKITHVTVDVWSGDATDYIDQINVYATDWDTFATLHTDLTNVGDGGAETVTQALSGGTEDVSVYRSVNVRLYCVCTTLGDLDIGGVTLRGYYS